MRRTDREITDRAAIEAILHEARVCRLALVDGDQPYIVPLCFGFEEGALYCHSAPAGKKIDLILRNPRCCFEVDLCDGPVRGSRACSWSMRYRSVIGYGTATVLSDPGEKRHGLACIMRQYDDGIHEFSLDEVDTVAVIRIAVESMTGKRKE